MNKIKLILILTLLTVINSCSDDFITLSPISNANLENFYKTQDDLQNAIIGAYANLNSRGVYSDSFQLLGELRSDNSEMATTAGTRISFFEISEFTVQSTNEELSRIWNDHYKGISIVNLIIDKVDQIDASDGFKNRIKAEAMFLRALYYFNLVRTFGDVPLIVSTIKTIQESYEYDRTNTNEIYSIIKSDLTFASEILPASIGNEYGRATRGAAQSLLGKVYLTIGDFESSSKVLKLVIDSGEYSLIDNYDDLWNAANKNHQESIFDVQFSKSSTFSTGSNFVIRYTPYLYTNHPFYTTVGGFNIPTSDLLEAFSSNDIRSNLFRDHYLTPSGDIVDGLAGRYTIKFYDTPVQGQGADDNWPVIRYADVLLMYAETLNEISFTADGEAFEYINRIRLRANLPPISSTASDPSHRVTSQEDFRLAVEQERRLELSLEGHRWFDLVRTGRAIEVISSKVGRMISQDELLFPIPQNQIDVNPNLQQNPGY